MIRLRYPATCSSCGTALTAKTIAWWDGDTKAVGCEPCTTASGWPAPEKLPVPIVPVAQPKKGRSGVPGGSAQRKADGLRARREANVRSYHPRIGGLILAVTEEPQATANWGKGAEGERKLGAGLDGLAHAGVIALHDRLRPGTTANIDHLAVAASGVWVIDAKRYAGRVSKEVGGWFSSDVHLYVGRRDRMKLVTEMSKQVDAVRMALGTDWAEVPVRPVLCFVDADWRWFAKPFELRGVLVTWPRAARELLVRPGPYPPPTVEAIAARLEDRLRPAS